jgi:hypothetical protein
VRRTRDPRVWLEYLCWQIQFWMSGHKPYLPVRLRIWLWRFFPDRMRHHVSWQQYRFWLEQPYNDPATLPKPLPWPVCSSFVGPFVGPWDRVTHWFGRRTGGRSHRCEFTDKKRGALYGHKEGAFMDRLFDRFLERIS